MQTKQNIEKYSSAFTLSDMEIFIFPELMYSLVLANILSPVIWKWREDNWFKNIEKKSINYRINRVKQYIIEHFGFNLDLDTWGLTTKEQELTRFQDFIDPKALAQSNALFGYEGDKYYFSIDIRKHFGLDKYNDNIIPYWKTETVEAMNAFRYKEGYSNGAGECVSLSALYAAALFIVAKIPLEKIFLISTPLHSQNFIDENNGYITNNRRIVTKNMWYNGTPLSEKARRAIENEQITIVAHLSGHIHSFFKTASIHPKDYQHFTENLKKYLTDENGNLRIKPRLPVLEEKEFGENVQLNINIHQSREEIFDEIVAKSSENESAKLALLASRQMQYKEFWEYFTKAALERNPVSREALKGKTLEEINEILLQMPNQSIYEGENRLAMPDEVWNFGRGSALEKIFLLLNVT
ncbi:hypothetical protein FACS1894178_3310 [Bacteroidia bacterium]|nr:hypothetical protein FACS1894178_3310 [Bacteroidia bacterium]